MKSTDEIKKGLEEEIPVHYHIDGEPRLTPRLLMDMQWLHKDALALIQQLEAQNTELSGKIGQLQAERDAAVKSLRGRCFECKNNKTSVCLICSKDKELKYWQWPDPPKEE